MQASWDAPLLQLLASGTLSGFALLDHATGACLCSCGDLQEAWGVQQECPTAAAFVSMFHSTAAPDALEVCGEHALVVQRTESSVYAVSRGKQLGVTAHYLPSGILVTTCRRPHLLQTVAPQVEAICDSLRQP